MSLTPYYLLFTNCCYLVASCLLTCFISVKSVTAFWMNVFSWWVVAITLSIAFSFVFYFCFICVRSSPYLSSPSSIS